MASLGFLTTTEVCEQLGNGRPLHPSTLSRWVASGRITPAHQFAGRRGAFLFDPAEVQRLRDELDQDATEASA